MSVLVDVSAIGSLERTMKPSDGLDGLPHLGKGLRPDLKLPAIEPMVVNAPVHLPPLSEALFNPILVERSVGFHPYSDSVGSMSGSDSYDVPAWSIPGRS